MTPIDLDVKAARYLSDGRMRIHRADEQSVLARVAGDSGTYRLVWDRSGILCFCPALRALLTYRSASSHLRRPDTKGTRRHELRTRNSRHRCV